MYAGQKGPDLRRDYDEKDDSQSHFTWVRKDLIYEGITTLLSASLICLILLSERTWFTKGLRPEANFSVTSPRSVRKDLIYEGITTPHVLLFQFSERVSQKGPDLRRDYDERNKPRFPVYIKSERTWFTKGLRHDLKILLEYPYRQKGPDLRRDYDDSSCSHYNSLLCQKGPDLRRDYDEKDINPMIGLFRSERTWFTKGLRLNIPSDLLTFIYRQKGPDLRRDYDKIGATHLCHKLFVRKDLIYEGITTSSLTA